MTLRTLISFALLFVAPFASAEVEEPAAEYAQGEQPAAVDDTADPYDDVEPVSSDRPIYPTPTDEVTKLRAEMAEMKKKMAAFEVKQPAATPAPGSVNPVSSTKSQAPLDADVAAVLTDLGVDPNNLQEAMEAHSPEEAVAMANAHKNSGTMEVSGTQGEFDKLSALYHTAMKSEDKGTHTQFKGACAQFIEAHQDHSLSRSALYFMGKILLKSGEVKDAQNAFARVYRGDEQGPHAADALLGMAEVFLKQNNKAAALKFVEKVKKDFKPDYLTDETKAELVSVSKSCGLNQKPSKQDVKAAVKTDAKTAPHTTPKAGTLKPAVKPKQQARTQAA